MVAAGLTCSSSAIRRGLYHLADPAGVVIICDPPWKPEPGEKPYWMRLDEEGYGPKKDG